MAYRRAALVAVLADVHGNLPALSAVLAEPGVAAADAVVLLGDIALGPVPAETDGLAYRRRMTILTLPPRAPSRFVIRLPGAVSRLTLRRLLVRWCLPAIPVTTTCRVIIRAKITCGQTGRRAGDDA